MTFLNPKTISKAVINSYTTGSEYYKVQIADKESDNKKKLEEKKTKENEIKTKQENLTVLKSATLEGFKLKIDDEKKLAEQQTFEIKNILKQKAQVFEKLQTNRGNFKMLYEFLQDDKLSYLSHILKHVKKEGFLTVYKDLLDSEK